MKKTLTIKTKFNIGDCVSTKRHPGCSLVVYAIKIDYDEVVTYTTWNASDNSYENYFGWQLTKAKSVEPFTPKED